MPDVTFFNYPQAQYVFTASWMKKGLLRQQGCDETSRRTSTPSYGYNLNGPACCGNVGIPAPNGGGAVGLSGYQ